MMEGSDKTKTRVSVTLTRPYLDAMNRLVEEGVYMSKGAIIVEALRDLLRRRGIEPFARPLEEKGER